MVANGILIVSLIAGAGFDVKSRRIPNWLIASMLITGLLAAIASGTGGIRSWVLGLLLGIALLFVPFALGGIGAGDVKLLGAVGAIKGPEFVLYAGLAGAIAGGVFSLIALRMGRRRTDRIPYSIPIALGCAFALVVL